MQDRNIISLISYKHVLMIELISLSRNIQFINLSNWRKKIASKSQGGGGEGAPPPETALGGREYKTFRPSILL